MIELGTSASDWTRRSDGVLMSGVAGIRTQDFYDKVKNHPLPSQEFMAWRKAQDDAYEAEQAKLIPGM